MQRRQRVEDRLDRLSACGVSMTGKLTPLRADVLQAQHEAAPPHLGRVGRSQTSVGASIFVL